jgi:hypothetical protein
MHQTFCVTMQIVRIQITPSVAAEQVCAAHTSAQAVMSPKLVMLPFIAQIPNAVETTGTHAVMSEATAIPLRHRLAMC